MLKAINKIFTEQLKLSPDIWAVICLAIVVVAFVVALLVGLLAGDFKKIKSLMGAVAKNPKTAVAQMKKMPASIKTLYKNARMGNIKPSTLVTEQVCVEQPYSHSLAGKIWLVTFVATVIAALLAPSAVALGALSATDAEVAANAVGGVLSVPVLVLILGGLFTLLGGIIGRAAYSGAFKTYAKFAAAIDGDDGHAAPAFSEPQPATTTYTEPVVEAQATEYNAEPVYAEPQGGYAEPQTGYAEPQGYAQPQNAYAEPEPVTPQESDAEIRRRAREEAMAQARAQQEAMARQQAQAQQQQAAPTQNAAATPLDDIIEQIDRIDREGATRERMRELASQLQRERAKPENKSADKQKRITDAVNKLLKAMQSSTRR